jgi:hypothetical protein
VVVIWNVEKFKGSRLTGWDETLGIVFLLLKRLVEGSNASDDAGNHLFD